MPPPTSAFVTGSRPRWPDTYSVSPASTPGLNGSPVFGAFSGRMIRRAARAGCADASRCNADAATMPKIRLARPASTVAARTECDVIRSSEHELQAELDFAHRFSGAVDLAVQRTGQGRVRIVPDWIVQNVEPFEPELQRPGADAEVPDDRRVDVGDARTEERVSAGVAEGAQRLQHVRIGVEPPRDRLLIARQDRILSGDVRTVLSAAGVGPIGSHVRRSRESARFRDDGADLPSAEDRAAEATLQERFPVAERQLVENGRDEAMTHVEHRRPPLAVEAETVLREQRVAIQHPDAASVIRRLG